MFSVAKMSQTSWERIGVIEMSRSVIHVLLVALLVIVGCTYWFGRSLWVPVLRQITGGQTVQEVLDAVGPEARERLEYRFQNVGLSYPPKNAITLLATKDSAELELWIDAVGSPIYVHTFPILALSGKSGPKLKEGDRQVPEGIYSIEGLNPNSSYHLSLKLNYPNEFDLLHAQAEGRASPGSDIFIHGKAVSIGCLAIGDQAVEEIFVLAADAGKANVEVVIAPTDPRVNTLNPLDSLEWTAELYEDITRRFADFVMP